VVFQAAAVAHLMLGVMVKAAQELLRAAVELVEDRDQQQITKAARANTPAEQSQAMEVAAVVELLQLVQTQRQTPAQLVGKAAAVAAADLTRGKAVPVVLARF
jgi:hypothetical protein